MRKVLDWIDEFSGHDRRSIRALLLIIAIPVLLIAIEWGYNRLTAPPTCDDACHIDAQRTLDQIMPAAATPFDPKGDLDKVFNNR